jgi:SAM-dependent methyltransferase
MQPTTTPNPGAAPSTADLSHFLRGVRILEDPIDGRVLLDARPELERYVAHHLRAAQLSLAMLRRHLPARGRPRVLELGGAPYFFSALLHRTFQAEVTAANVQAGAWPGEEPTVERGTVVLEVPADGGEGRLAIEVRVFNIEKDPFPFAADSFDAVLCMEVLEHLGYSPSQMLAESHRVLKPGGLLFLTVPNFVNLKRTVNMVLNRPCGYPYSGYGIYGRHQREYAPAEVVRLLAACHLRVVELQTANVWPTFRGQAVKGLGNAVLNAVSRLPLPWLVNKREYILCAARPYGEPLVAYPSWLYEHVPMYPPPPHGLPVARDA